jgi:predicted phosphodiesterase
MKRIVVISDLQIPFEDKKAVDAVAQFIEEYEPDDVISVGDESDLAPISRYSLNTRSMYQGDLGKERDRVVDVLGMLKIKHITRSNHLDRWFAALSRVPAFETIPEMQLEEFYKFRELGVTYHQDPWSPAPGWLLMHGDEGTQSSKGGQVALGLTMRTNKSVVCGHTHRQGISHHTFTYLGDKKPSVKTGFEVGTLADFGSPGMRYARFKNWQQGFGLLYVEGSNVTPVAVPILNKSFIVEGVKYSWR